MIKAAFCDDDPDILREMSALIEKYSRMHGLEMIYATFGSPVEMLEEIGKGTRWDILFLDVLMPGENGIDVAKEIRQYDTNIKIIFLTSSAEFAVDSYTVGAYFYQMKPICEEHFFKLMDSVTAVCERERQDSFLLFAKSGIRRIELERLEYCEVMGRTLLFHMKTGEVFESAGGMRELCKKFLPYGNFLHPHRSYLVNMEYIQSISYKTIVMNCGVNVPIPHGKYSAIKETYLTYAMARKRVFVT